MENSKVEIKKKNTRWNKFSHQKVLDMGILIA